MRCIVKRCKEEADLLSALSQLVGVLLLTRKRRGPGDIFLYGQATCGILRTYSALGINKSIAGTCPARKGWTSRDGR